MKLTRKKSFASEGAAKKKSDAVGTDATRVLNKGKKTRQGDDFESVASNTGMRNTSVSQMPIEVDVDPLLKDIVFSEDLEQKKLVNRLYRDIYYNDAIGGSAVDLMSTLPFSDITLGGLTDSRAINAFEETVERLNCKTLFPHMSIDHLVDGDYIGSLLFNQTAKKFVDIMPHRADNCKLDSLPFFGQDPIITAAIPDGIRTLMNGDSKRVVQLRESLGDEIVNLLSQQALELDPLSTIHIPRKAFSSGEGVSWYRRILPLYLIEKNLFRGTLVESARRQRGILHVTIGDGEEWDPTISDMEFATELFMNADADPLGAVIATRMGVSTEEIRQGGDFWKVTDIWDSTAQFKLRAMGISESFLSGDANYATADAGMTVFLEMIRSFRDNLTRRFFYNKVFPLVSMVNGFTVNRHGKLIRKDGLLEGGSVQANLDKMANGNKLLIPTVHWSKQLKPEGDAQYLDMLQQLTDKGVPVPLRAVAAAGGFNLSALLGESNDDLELLKKISEYNKKVAEIKKQYGPKQAEGDDGGMGGFASAGGPTNAADVHFLDHRGNPVREGEHFVGNFEDGARSSVLADGAGMQVPLGSRDFGGAGEVVGRTRTGKKKYIHNQRAAQEKSNRMIAKALGEITRNKQTPLTHRTKTPKKPTGK